MTALVDIYILFSDVLTELLRLGVFTHSSFTNPGPFYTWILHLCKQKKYIYFWEWGISSNIIIVVILFF